MGPRPLHEALWFYYSEFDAIALLKEFQAQDQVPEPGIVHNFIGTRILSDLFPAVLAAMEGKVEGLPIPGNWHADIAEWASALLTVKRAQNTYRIVELGCGWGCWMANMGVAARSLGLEIDLIGIEGEPQHLENANKIMLMNDFTKNQFSLKHGVAGPKSGFAIFPQTAQGASNWGGQAIFDPSEDQLKAAREQDDVQVLDCLTLGQLSRDRPIDLLHIDIQGAESDFIAGNLAQMNAYVRHVLIGTHSRVIEGDLISQLSAAGWKMEMERPAIMPLQKGQQMLAIDGVQMWTNIKLLQKQGRGRPA